MRRAFQIAVQSCAAFSTFELERRMRDTVTLPEEIVDLAANGSARAQGHIVCGDVHRK